ncbi:SAM-dependent chlorinase/fluorinase [Tenuifilum thalassicum]|uniref:SAM-dependent chlorinase/fluorinase n=2 Tax=Tenuifilum thalassicum TaxID=2590900 RepID=A0A7D3XLG2_9BACT|nr:SAM-dependent chlorinase/fluorinase [Tenuifilum thalassicum]
MLFLLIFRVNFVRIFFFMTSQSTRIISLTTDWGNKDYYLGMLTGKVYSVSTNLKLVELSHSVPSFNYKHAAFLMRHSFRFFPEGSIHVCMVNADTADNERMLVFEYEKHFFIVPDNGVISLITDYLPNSIFGVPIDSTTSFGSLDSVTIAIEALLSDSTLTDFAIEASEIKRFTQLMPVPEQDGLTGSVIYLDSYLNAITNITFDDFEMYRQSRKFVIYVQSYSHGINRLSKSYKDVEKGDLLALFNSLGLLEIAIREGYAAQMYNLSVGSNIMVRFFEDEKILK